MNYFEKNEKKREEIQNQLKTVSIGSNKYRQLRNELMNLNRADWKFQGFKPEPIERRLKCV